MKKAIGIDLGTTNSVMAFKTKTTEVIRNSEGEELTRSCVALYNDQLIVGKNAFSVLKRKTEDVILSIKRLMGATSQSETVEKMIQETKSPFGYYRYGITEYKGGTSGSIAVVIGGKQYTPEQISAEILKKLKRDFEEKEGEVSHAVITVPAYFTEKQKNATRIAANYAGLKVSRLLAEPTAAAIAYGVDNLRPGEAKTVLIYDFGGGTFDLSILNIVDGQYLEMATGGDRWLGGDDLDKVLQEFIYKKVEKEYNIKDIHQLVSNLEPRKKKPEFFLVMREQVEQAKIQLSTTNSANISIISILEDENGDDIDIDVTISRKEFEDLIRPYVQKTIELIDSLIKEIHYEINMIDNILLVGGTSCIPLVKEMLSAKYGTNKVIVSKKPMLAVAEGAAILAHRLQDEYECPNCGKLVKQEETICSSCKFDLESEIKQSGVGEVVHTTKHSYFVQLLDERDCVIDKQQALPTSVIREYKTSVNNQQIINIIIFSLVENDEEEVQAVGYVTLEGNLPKNSEIIVEFTIDVNEIINCWAYPKGRINERKKVILAGTRGQLSGASKAFESLTKLLEEVDSDEYDIEQKEQFFKVAKKQITEAEKLDPENIEHKNLFYKIDYEINNEFESLPQMKESKNLKEERENILHQANLMCDHYPELLGSANSVVMKRLIIEIQENNDVLSSASSIEKLKELSKEYHFILTIFLLKVAANKATKSNPSDANFLLKKHDSIVNNLKSGDYENGFEQLAEGWEVASQYLGATEENEFGRFLKR